MKHRAVSRMVLAVGVIVIIAVAGAAIYFATPPAQTKQVAVVFDVGGRGDLSFNDMAYIGAEQAKEDFGVNVTYVQSKTGGDYLPNLQTLASSGTYSIIIAIGFLLTDALNQTARQYTNQQFAIIDGFLPGMSNVRSIVYSEQDGSALAGLLAGLTTKSNKVGVVLGIEIPVLYKFEAGFYEGLSQAENLTGKHIQIYYKYTGSFTDVTLGRQVAEGWLAQGVDVMFNVAGLTGKGMLDAVADYGASHGLKTGLPFGIGVDSDQDWVHPGFVMASMMKRVDTGVYYAIRDINAGNFTGGIVTLGLADLGNKLSDASDLDTFLTIVQSAGATLPMNVSQTKSVYAQIWTKIDANGTIRAQIADFQSKIVSKQLVIPIPQTPADIAAIRTRYGVTG